MQTQTTPRHTAPQHDPTLSLVARLEHDVRAAETKVELAMRLGCSPLEFEHLVSEWIKLENARLVLTA